jgi:hypothetical protein
LRVVSMNFLYDCCGMVETCWGNKSSNFPYDGFVKQFEFDGIHHEVLLHHR